MAITLELVTKYPDQMIAKLTTSKDGKPTYEGENFLLTLEGNRQPLGATTVGTILTIALAVSSDIAINMFATWFYEKIQNKNKTDAIRVNGEIVITKEDLIAAIQSASYANSRDIK